MTLELLSKLGCLVFLIFTASMVIWGIHGGAQLTGLAERMDKTGAYDWVKKLWYDCPVCMSTLYTPIVFLGNGFTAKILTFPMLIFGWLAVAGLNYVIKEYLYPEQE